MPLQQGDTENTKTRILDAAKELFAKRGYDGSSVEAIAQEAGVNKALIYYYFSGKEDILDTITEQAIDNVKAFRAELQLHPSIFVDGPSADLIREGLRFLDSERAAFRIMAVEALKRDAENGAMFEFLEAVYQDAIQRLDGLGLEVVDRQAFELIGTFLFSLPMGLFMTLGEQWSRFHGYDIERSEEIFSSFFERMLREFMTECIAESEK